MQKSAQILADEILDRADRIFERRRVLATVRVLAFRDLAVLLFRLSRFFRDDHGPESLVSGLIVAGDGDFSTLSALDCRRFALWPGDVCHMRNVSAQVLLPAAMFSAAAPACTPLIRELNAPATL